MESNNVENTYTVCVLEKILTNMNKCVHIFILFLKITYVYSNNCIKFCIVSYIIFCSVFFLHFI